MFYMFICIYIYIYVYVYIYIYMYVNYSDIFIQLKWVYTSGTYNRWEKQLTSDTLERRPENGDAPPQLSSY